MQNLLTLAGIVAIAGSATAGITVNGDVETFDSSADISGSNGFGSDGAGDFFGPTSSISFGGFVNYSGADGDFFAAMDTDSVPGLGTSDVQILSFTQIDITGFTGLELSVDLAEDDDGANEDWDILDFVHFEASIDNGAFFPVLNLESIPDGDAFNAVPAVDTNFDGDGDGTVVTNTFANFTAAIAGSGSTLDLRVRISLDSGDEDIAIDNVAVTGIPAPGAFAVAGFAGLAAARRRRA